MSAEIDQAIKEKYAYRQNLQAKMSGLDKDRQRHNTRIANLPPIIKPVVTFVDGFILPKGSKDYDYWQQESSRTLKEMRNLMKNNPGIYELTNLAYHAPTTRDLGFSAFAYGFKPKIDGIPEFDGRHPRLFFGNAILARKAEGNTALIEIQKGKPPLLYLPEGFAFMISKMKTVGDDGLDIEPETPDKVYAAWQPEVTDEPRAITVDEDTAIPWRNTEEEVVIFTATKIVPNLNYR